MRVRARGEPLCVRLPLSLDSQLREEAALAGRTPGVHAAHLLRLVLVHQGREGDLDDDDDTSMEG